MTQSVYPKRQHFWLKDLPLSNATVYFIKMSLSILSHAYHGIISCQFQKGDDLLSSLLFSFSWPWLAMTINWSNAHLIFHTLMLQQLTESNFIGFMKIKILEIHLLLKQPIPDQYFNKHINWYLIPNCVLHSSKWRLPYTIENCTHTYPITDKKVLKLWILMQARYYHHDSRISINYIHDDHCQQIKILHKA